MSEYRVQMQAADGTAEVISGLGVGESLVFESHERPASGILHIGGQADILKTQDGDGSLQLYSSVDVDPHSMDHQNALLVRCELGCADLRVADDATARGLDISLFDQYSPGFSRIMGVIAPVQSKGWYVSTIGPGFWRYDDDSRMEWTDRIVTFHVSAVNALLRAVDSSRGERSEDQPDDFMVYLCAAIEQPQWADEEHTGAEIEAVEQATAELSSPEEYFAQFVGIDAVVRELCEVVELADVTEEDQLKYGVESEHAILLNGPSGVGKTELARALGDALGADVVEVGFSDVSATHTGEWASNVERIFTNAYARGERGRVLIFMDEMDGLVANGNPESTQNITSVLKKQLEELRRHRNVFFVGTTNHADKMDPFVLVDKRIKKINVPGLSEEARQKLLHKQMFRDRELVIPKWDEWADIERALPANGDDAFGLLEAIPELSAQLSEFSPGDICELVKQVSRDTFLAAKRNGLTPTLPTRQDFIVAIQRAKNNRV